MDNEQQNDVSRVRKIITKIESIRSSPAFFVWLSFLMPMFLMALAFSLQGVHPFGHRMMLTVDLFHQYAPFLSELRAQMLALQVPLFSWHVGLGTDFWAVFANYASSPLNLLVLFFPAKYIPNAVALIVVLKVGLAGLFSALLLKDMDRGRKDIFLSLFASFYALCGWVLTNFWNIMWLDAIMLLPLVVLGLRRLMKEGKPLLYVVSLFLCLWSNYYAGYFVCLFLILYAPVCYLQLRYQTKVKRLPSIIWRFFVFSLIAAGLSAVLLYPTWKTLQQCSAVGDTFPESHYFYNTLFDFIGRFFIFSLPNIRDGMANVYIGVWAFVLIILYFMCSRIRLAEKVAHALLLAVLFASFSSNFLNFIWHGFHFPNQIPFRQSFLVSFVLLTMGYRVLRHLKSFVPSQIHTAVVAGLLFLLLYARIGTQTAEHKESLWAIIGTAVFIVLYAASFLAVLSPKVSAKIASWALIGILAAELLLMTTISIAVVAKNEGFPSWDPYGQHHRDVQVFVKSEEEEHVFLRAAVYPTSMVNSSAMYQLSDVAIFTSTANENYIRFMRSFGFHTNNINSIRNNGTNALTSTLFGIRYLLDIEGNNVMPYGFSPVDANLNIEVHENDRALSVGYMVDEATLAYEPVWENDPFAATNNYLVALGAGNVYEPKKLKVDVSEHLAYGGMFSPSDHSFSFLPSDEGASLVLSPEGAQKNDQLYLYVTTVTPPQVRIFDEDETYDLRQSPRRRQIIDVGTYDPDHPHQIELTWSQKQEGSFTVVSYSMSHDRYRALYEQFAQKQLQVTQTGPRSLQGKITIDKPGLLLLTIPFDDGFFASVNDEPAELLTIGGGLMGVMLDAGTNELVLSYRPEGLIEGLLISLISLGALVLICFLPRCIKYNKATRKTSALPFVDDSDAKD